MSARFVKDKNYVQPHIPAYVAPTFYLAIIYQTSLTDRNITYVKYKLAQGFFDFT